jgi:protoporphyrinogen/coproporphyrinogen III oxidase
MKRIAIIGGGISGLSAAFALEQRRAAGASLEYTLYESSRRFGGVLRTELVDGCVVEAGPDSFLSEKPWASDLCRQLGLADQLIGSNDAQRKTYILLKGRLIPIPDGLMFMVPTKILPVILSPLFSRATKLRVSREWFQPPHKADADESVASFVDRHYGQEMVDHLVDPLLAGVYGGEASQLSVRAVLPRFAEMEAKYGSLSRAMFEAGKKVSLGAEKPARPLFTSLEAGMQSLGEMVLQRLPSSSLRPKTSAQALEPQDGGWLVSAGYGTDFFDGVIIATPAPAAASLLHFSRPELASELASIAYSSSVTVALGFDQKVRAALPPGFGFLVPRSENKRMLAATFVHNKFPHRAPPDRALMRCFLGGSRNGRVLELPDEEILSIVREELRQILGLSAEPLFTRVYKWKASMAQYTVGHLERLERIERLRQQASGLGLAGNGYRGIGVPDCVRSGQEAAEQVLAGLLP